MFEMLFEEKLTNNYFPTKIIYFNETRTGINFYGPLLRNCLSELVEREVGGGVNTSVGSIDLVGQ